MLPILATTLATGCEEPDCTAPAVAVIVESADPDVEPADVLVTWTQNGDPRPCTGVSEEPMMFACGAGEVGRISVTASARDHASQTERVTVAALRDCQPETLAVTLQLEPLDD